MASNSWAFAFLATLLIETPVFFFALGRVFSPAGALVASLALNLSTHPLAWSAIMAAPGMGTFVGVELAVTIVEALLLLGAARSRIARRPLRFVEAFAISLAANGFSAGVGLLL